MTLLATLTSEWACFIQKERAVREMLRAVERGTAHAMFPRRIAWPVKLGALVPEPIRRWVLRRLW